MYSINLKTPIGLLEILFDQDFFLTSIYRCFGQKESDNLNENFNRFISEFRSYFDGKLKKFSYPFKLTISSDFQKRVLDIVFEIPYGEVVTYQWIAKQLNTSPRAVGQALKRNPLPIVIPCHRVIGSDGSIGGYSLGIDSKKWLLNHERSILYKPL